jgi:hypothetical protein
MQPDENTPQRLRQEADRARKLAEEMRDRVLKKQLLDMAEQYERLANNAERDRRIRPC